MIYPGGAKSRVRFPWAAPNKKAPTPLENTGESGPFSCAGTAPCPHFAHIRGANVGRDSWTGGLRPPPCWCEAGHPVRGHRVRDLTLDAGGGTLEQDDVPRGSDPELVPDPHLFRARPSGVGLFEREEVGGCHPVILTPATDIPFLGARNPLPVHGVREGQSEASTVRTGSCHVRARRYAHRMPRDERPQWHPLLAAVEPEPGVWVLIDTLQKPYGVVTIVRVDGLVRFRAEHVGNLLGYATTLRAAVERVHSAELRSLLPGGGPNEYVTRPSRTPWIEEITAKYRTT